MPSIEWIGLYGLLGAFVGFMAGLLGVGGGGILVPLLVTIFAYQGVGTENVVHLALGTSLACMIVSSTANIRAHAQRGTVVWKAFFGMAPGIILGALLTAHFAVSIDAVHIAIFFTFFMALIAVQMFLNWRPAINAKPSRLRDLFLVGTGIGSVSALATVGGGFLSVTYLNYKNVPIKKAIGTSAAIGFPISIASTIGYTISGWSKTADDPFTLGFVYIPAFVAISVTSYIAAPYGASYAANLSDTTLKKIFAILCLILSAKMLFTVAQS